MKNKKERREKIVKAGAVIGIMVSLIFTFSVSVMIQEVNPFNPEPDVKWHEIARITPEMLVTGDYDPGAGVSGWLSMFLLDYAQDPATVLANNATDWSTAGTAFGYVDADAQTIDIAYGRPFYFVVRARFNDSVKDGGNFQDSRCRVNLTTTGDETISGVLGTAVVSQNDSSDDFIWINFYWDEGATGYEILMDGSIDWSIVIEARY